MSRGHSLPGLLPGDVAWPAFAQVPGRSLVRVGRRLRAGVCLPVASDQPLGRDTACRSASWPATRGPGSPGHSADRRPLRAGGSPPHGAARGAPYREPQAPLANAACTMRRATRGSRRPPRAPSRSAGPLRPLTRSGRPARHQRSTARRAGIPTGTVRCFPRLPSTRTVPRCGSTSGRSSPHSSPTRIPVAYNSSRTAASLSPAADSPACPAACPSTAAMSPRGHNLRKRTPWISVCRATGLDRRRASRAGARTR